jgi:putative membrane protein
MHPSFVWRRLIIFGLLPALVAAIILWQLIQLYVLLFLSLPLLVFIVAACVQRKFKLYALEDLLYIKKGIFGEEGIMMKWHKLQAIDIKQSFYQRKKDLANLVISTAGGNIYINYIDLSTAKKIVNYALYKTEWEIKDWM